MAINGHENRFTIYIFLHHYYCKGNDRSVLKIFSGLAKSIFFKNKYLTWGGQDIGNLNDGRITYNIGEDRFINWGSLPLWKLSNLCTYFELWYLSGQWKIIDKFSTKVSLHEKSYYQMNINQRVAAVYKFINFLIPTTKAENEQCTSTAPFVSA